MKDIHDIRPPIMVGMDPFWVKVCWMSAGGVLAIAIIYFLVKRFWRPGRSSALPDAPRDIPPYETAMAGLDRIGGGPITDFKAFYFELNALVKAYIGGIYKIHASEMTTQELARHLRTTSMDRHLVTRVSLFQDDSDPFRYAPVLPSQDRARADLSRARDLITAMETDSAEPLTENGPLTEPSGAAKTDGPKIVDVQVEPVSSATYKRAGGA